MEEKECPAGQSGAENGDVNWELYPIVNPETGEQKTLLYPSPEEWAQSLGAILDQTIFNGTAFDEAYRVADEWQVWKFLKCSPDEFAQDYVKYPTWDGLKFPIQELYDFVNGNFYSNKYSNSVKKNFSCSTEKFYMCMKLAMREVSDVLKKYKEELKCHVNVCELEDKTVKLVSEKIYRSVDKFPQDIAIAVGDLLADENIEDEKIIIDGFMYAESIGMIYAKRGVGKTFAALAMAKSISEGSKFLAWNVPKKRRVLYFDGEMGTGKLKKRLRALYVNNKPSPLFQIVPSQHFRKETGEAFKLDDPDDQQKFLNFLTGQKICGQGPEVIIFDNLSSMVSGDENSSEEQEDYLRFCIHLRHLGHSVILIHHSGKDGRQRGASKREDPLDYSVELVAPPVPVIGGCQFKWTFKKARDGFPQPAELDCSLITGEDGLLELVSAVPSKEPPKWEQFLRLIQDTKPQTQKEIAEATGLAKSWVSEQVRSLREKGYLVKNQLLLTPDGAKFLKEKYPDRDDF